MRQPRFGPFFKAVLLAGTLVWCYASTAGAQQRAIVTGRVSSERGTPLIGAIVLIENTNYGATTSETGAYNITVTGGLVRGQDVTLVARGLGHRSARAVIKLTAGTQEHNFALAVDPLHLDEIVVTGVSAGTSTKVLTFSVGRVSEADLQLAPASTALGQLQGKVAGVQIISSTGMPGAAPSIKLRGATSITGDQDPLIVVDGTITKYSLADISSEDIERVEVVKGAAASSLYGSQAAGGVIQIFTRRGSRLPDGKIQVTGRGEFGQSFVTRRPATTQHHPYVLLPNGDFYRRADGDRVTRSLCDPAKDAVQCPTSKLDAQDQPYPINAHVADKLYSSGNFFTQYGSVGQHRGQTNFNASFQNTYEQGSVFNINGFKRQNYRVNVDQVLTGNIDLSFSTFYARSSNEEPDQGSDGGAFFAIAFLEPHVDATECCNPDGSPYRADVVNHNRRSNASNPLYSLYNIHRNTTRTRFTGGARLRWRPFSWLSAEGSYNYDQLGREFIYTEPLQVFGPTGSVRPGGYARENDNNRTYNIGASVTGVWRVNAGGLLNNLGITTKALYGYEDQVDHFLQASATKFVVKNVPEFPGTDPSNQRASSRDLTLRALSYAGTATLNFNDKVILDGTGRRDGSSLFGPDARYQNYYRASAAVRVPQLLGWTSGPEEFRLRASYGTAGLRPDFFAQYEVLTPSGGIFIKDQLGNRNLRPARSSEVELGANLELFRGRFTVEYNYSDKKTRDQLIRAPLLATTGFVTQWQNVGVLRSKTHELSIGAQPINSRNTALQVTIVADRVREVITDWPLPDSRFGAGASGFSPFVFAPGLRLGTMRGQRWVRKIEELYDDPAKKSASGAGQTWDPSNFTVNSDGYVVRKSLKHTNDERPIEYVSCSKYDPADPTACLRTTNIHIIGVASPDFRMGFSSSFSYKRLSVAGLVDWSQGGEIYNGTAHWGTQDCADRRCDQFGKAEEDEIGEGFYQGGLYNGAKANSGFVEDATFVKFREVSVNYTFNRTELRKVGLGRWIAELRLGVIGRNLFTLTRYSGIDPDVAPVGDDGFKTRMDWFQYPQFRTFTGFIEIAF